MMIIFAQTIAPGDFCTIGGKPKPCKLLVKLKEKARAQVESFGSWLQDNNPSHQSVTWKRTVAETVSLRYDQLNSNVWGKSYLAFWFVWIHLYCFHTRYHNNKDFYPQLQPLHNWSHIDQHSDPPWQSCLQAYIFLLTKITGRVKLKNLYFPKQEDLWTIHSKICLVGGGTH